MQFIRNAFLLSLLIFFLAFGAIGAYLYFEVRSLGTTKSVLEETLTQQLKVPVRLDNVTIDWSKLWKLTPAIDLEGLIISSPPGYNQKTMLSVDEVSVEISFRELMKRHISVKNVDIKKPRINLERNRFQKVNAIAALERMSSAPKRPRAKKKAVKKEKSQIEKFGSDIQKKLSKKIEEFATIERFELHRFAVVNGGVTLYDYYKKQNPDVLKFSRMNIQFLDFVPEKSSRIVANFRLFDSRIKNFIYDGYIGPFNNKSIPLSGNLISEIYLMEIPKELRRQYFGNLILEPREQDIISLNTQVKGNVYGTVQGSGTLDLKKIRMGKSAKKNIFVEGNTPFAFDAKNLAFGPIVNFRIDDGTVKLGRGLLSFNSNTTYKNGVIYGAQSGNLQGVDVNQMLSSFTPVEDQLFGTVEIPQFKMDFVGRDAETAMASLKGDGFAQVDDGNLKIFQKIFDAQAYLAKLRGKNKDYSKFSTLKTSFNISNQKFRTPDLLIKTPFVNLEANGFYAFNSRIKYDCNVVIAKKNIPVKVAGNVEKPSINVDLKQIAEEQFLDKLENLLDKATGKNKPKTAPKAVETPSEEPVSVDSGIEQDIPAAQAEEPSKKLVAEPIEGAAPVEEKPKKKKKLKNQLFDTLLEIGVQELQKSIDKSK